MNMELDFIQEMFNNIAPKYDFLNRFLSLRQDIRWRRELVKSARIPDKSKVLDIACGTCDVSLEIKKQNRNALIFAADFSPVMLKLGKRKIAEKYNNTIFLTAANALNLPFKQNIFDAVFMAFGIRNIINREAALMEFHNSLKNEGKLAILELTTPRQEFIKKCYLLYFKKLLPILGALFSKNSEAYHYLPTSVMKFPSPENFAYLMRKAGFSEIKWKYMTFGIVTLFVGTKKG